VAEQGIEGRAGRRWLPEEKWPAGGAFSGVVHGRSEEAAPAGETEAVRRRRRLAKGSGWVGGIPFLRE
jgi:hypothetical protein